MTTLCIGGMSLALSGRALRTARLADEGYEFLDEPMHFVAEAAAASPRIDVLTFCQPLADVAPRHPWSMQWDVLAVLPVSTYEHWWKVQLNDKTRNMIRKPGKKGVVFKRFDLDAAAVSSIKTIYDECPVRQGRPFKHFGKSLDVIEREHATFNQRSEFIGAYAGDRLIGFIKLVHQPGWSSLMQIISLMSERDKAPTNGLIAQAVQVCAERGVARLQYGIWSRRGVGEFKMHHGFEPLRVPRYHVPLTPLGRLALALGFHRPMVSRVPDTWIDRLATWRAHWNGWRHSPRSIGGLRRG